MWEAIFYRLEALPAIYSAILEAAVSGFFWNFKAIGLFSNIHSDWEGTAILLTSMALALGSWTVLGWALHCLLPRRAPFPILGIVIAPAILVFVLPDTALDLRRQLHQWSANPLGSFFHGASMLATALAFGWGAMTLWVRRLNNTDRVKPAYDFFLTVVGTASALMIVHEADMSATIGRARMHEAKAVSALTVLRGAFSDARGVCASGDQQFSEASDFCRWIDEGARRLDLAWADTMAGRALLSIRTMPPEFMLHDQAATDIQSVAYGLDVQKIRSFLEDYERRYCGDQRSLSVRCTELMLVFTDWIASQARPEDYRWPMALAPDVFLSTAVFELERAEALRQDPALAIHVKWLLATLLAALAGGKAALCSWEYRQKGLSTAQRPATPAADRFVFLLVRKGAARSFRAARSTWTALSTLRQTSRKIHRENHEHQ